MEIDRRGCWDGARNNRLNDELKAPLEELRILGREMGRMRDEEVNAFKTIGDRVCCAFCCGDGRGIGCR